MSNPRNRWKIVSQDNPATVLFTFLKYGKDVRYATQLISVAYGNGLYVAVGTFWSPELFYYGEGVVDFYWDFYTWHPSGYIKFSIDGINWDHEIIIDGYNFVDIAFNDDKFVILGNKLGYDEYNQYNVESIALLFTEQLNSNNYKIVDESVWNINVLDPNYGVVDPPGDYGFQNYYGSKLLYNNGWIIYNDWDTSIMVPSSPNNINSSTWIYKLYDLSYTQNTLEIINNQAIFVSWFDYPYDNDWPYVLTIITNDDIHGDAEWVNQSYFTMNTEDRRVSISGRLNIGFDGSKYFISTSKRIFYSNSLSGPWSRYFFNPLDVDLFEWEFTVAFKENNYVLIAIEENSLQGLYVAVSNNLTGPYQDSDVQNRYSVGDGRLKYVNNKWMYIGNIYRYVQPYPISGAQVVATIWSPVQGGSVEKYGWDVLL